jgi:hypothetical protein
VSFIVIPARYARCPETARRQVNIDKGKTKERKFQLEASSLTINILRQLGVVLPKSSHLV